MTSPRLFTHCPAHRKYQDSPRIPTPATFPKATDKPTIGLPKLPVKTSSANRAATWERVIEPEDRLMRPNAGRQVDPLLAITCSIPDAKVSISA